MGMGTGVGCGLASVLGIGANRRLGSRWNEYLFVGVSTYGESIFTGVTSLFYNLRRAPSFPRSGLCQASRSAALIQLLPRKRQQLVRSWDLCLQRCRY